MGFLQRLTFLTIVFSKQVRCGIVSRIRLGGVAGRLGMANLFFYQLGGYPMKQMTFLKTAVILSILVLAALPVCVIAAEPAGQDIVGQWRMKGANPDGPPMDAIMTISKDKDGKLAGKWLSFFGFSDLKDVKFEGGKLTFVQVNRFRGEEFTSDFSGTLKDGKLTGALSSERGDFDFEGALMQPKPAIVGVWEITTKRGDREMTSTLTIKSDKDGKLSGTWKSQRGESEISDVNFKDDKLTFKRKMTRQEQVIEIPYELTVKGDTMTGKSSSPRGESVMTGKRADSPLVGTWELTITSDRGDRKQVLTIYPDLSAMYGPEELEKISIEGSKVSFKQSRTFGDWTFEQEIKCELAGDQLAGEITFTGRDGNPMTQKVTGKKLGADMKTEAKAEMKKEEPAKK
jgi:hypothetical protein